MSSLTMCDKLIEKIARAMDKELAGENFKDVPTRALARVALEILLK